MSEQNNEKNSRKGFWVSLVQAEMLVQVVGLLVFGAVAITAIIVYGGRT